MGSAKKILPIFLILTFFSVVFGKSYCPELKSKKDGVEVFCVRPHSQIESECSGPQPFGTLARFRCKNHYLTPEGDDFGGNLSCSENGEWSRYKAFERFNCLISCGRNARTIESNENEVRRDQFPWHSNIFQYNYLTRRFHYVCGGSLINPENKGFVIVTASNCLMRQNSTYLDSPNNLKIFLGSISSDFDENQADIDAKFFTVKDLVMHPSYSAGKNQGDIGLIFLNEQIEISNHILPACFPRVGNQALSINQIQPGNEGEFVGPSIGPNYPKLKRVKIPVIQADTCRDALNRYPTHSEFCSGRNYGENLCIEDTGSGLVFSDNTGFPHIQKFYLQGIVRRIEPQVAGYCENYGFFSRVSNFANWVHEVLDDYYFSEKNSVEEISSENSQTQTVLNKRPRPPISAPSHPHEQHVQVNRPKIKLPTAPAPKPVIEFPKNPEDNSFEEVSSRRPIPISSGGNGNQRFPSKKQTTPSSVPISASQVQTTRVPSNSVLDYRKVALDVHNAYRAKHQVGPYKLNDNLNSEAQNWADYLIRENKKYLSRRTEFGKNLFETKGYDLPDSDMTKLAVENWYETGTKYNWLEPLSGPKDSKWLAFTQIVWKSSSEIGVGLARRGSRTVVVVAYADAGNILGEGGKFFRENVFPAIY